MLRRPLAVLAGHIERMRRREDMNRRFGSTSSDLLAALVAVPVGLLEPVKTAGQGRETDADETEQGTGEELHALALLLDAGAAALLAHLAVDPFWPVGEEVERRDLVAGVHVLLADGLHGDGLVGAANVSICLSE